MSDKLIKQLIDFMAKETEVETFDQLLEKARKNLKIKDKPEIAEQKIRAYLVFQDYASVYENQVIYRKKVCEKIKFRVVLTKTEWEEKKLIMGHRFLLHSSPDKLLKNYKILDSEQKQIPVKKYSTGGEDLGLYFSLVNIPIIINNCEMKVNKVLIDYLDLSDWMQKNDYQKDDFIIVTILDYDNAVYSIEKESRKEYLKNSFIIRDLDTRFLNSLYQIVNNTKELKTTQAIVLEAYWLSQVHLSDTTLDSLGGLITTYDKVELKQISEFSTIQSKDNSRIKQIYDDLKEEKELPIQGKAKDLEGIFNELGSSYTESTVYGMLLYDFYKYKEFNANRLLDHLFSHNASPFFNDKQMTNFGKALDKMISQVLKDMGKKKFGKTEYEMLGDYLNLRILVINFLREIDSSGCSQKKGFDITILTRLNELDFGLDQMIFFFKAKEIKLSDLAMMKSTYDLLNQAILEEISMLRGELKL